MSTPLVPFTTVRAPQTMVASADSLATQAGLTALHRGGSAADAAIAANAVLSVTGPHLCGMGGDLFALVHAGGDAPAALNASGRAGSGADPERLRREGHGEMPMRHDARTVTIPGCVDGWIALHDRYGRLPLADVVAPAVRLAEDGFPASSLLVGSLAGGDERTRANLHELVAQATAPGARVRRPGVGRTLRAIAQQGRGGFYGGEFGAGFLELTVPTTAPEDLARAQAEWVEPLRVDAWGHRIWTVPPNSQGYLALAGAWIAQGLPLPDDADDPLWAHLLVEAALQAGYDRPSMLHEGAHGADLLAPERLLPRRAAIAVDFTAPASARPPGRDGDTTYLCAIDGDRLAVSLIQSNALNFGSGLVEPRTGINLHNRGLGFSLEAGHPAELGPGRRPPHTLSPLLITTPAGQLVATLGAMGGDGQPQILLQVLARLLHHGQPPAAAIASGRWVLRGPGTGFDTWTAPTGPGVLIEGHASAAWDAGLVARGHRITRTDAFSAAFGHGQVIVAQPDGSLAGAADPRARIGSAAGS